MSVWAALSSPIAAAQSTSLIAGKDDAADKLDARVEALEDKVMSLERKIESLEKKLQPRIELLK